MITLGADLSYTSTGLVVCLGERVLEYKNPRTTPKQRDEARRSVVAETLLDLVERHDVEFVLIEGYSFGKPQGAARLGELGGVVKNRLWEEDIAYGIVPPATIKVFALGDAKGKSAEQKKRMIAAAQRVWPECPNVSDVADAFWLARYAHDCYNEMIDIA